MMQIVSNEHVSQVFSLVSSEENATEDDFVNALCTVLEIPPEYARQWTVLTYQGLVDALVIPEPTWDAFIAKVPTVPAESIGVIVDALGKYAATHPPAYIVDSIVSDLMSERAVVEAEPDEITVPNDVKFMRLQEIIAELAKWGQ